MTILRVTQISKSFVLPDQTRLMILRDLSLEVTQGTITAITGASGSGKSTFLHLLGLLDRPDSGEIEYAREKILAYNDRKVAQYRNQTIGFIFQFHYLMPELTVMENTAAPYLARNFDRPAAFHRARELLTEVGLADRVEQMTYQLSGGEKQRVAIARSLMNSPLLLLADEPTGNLDLKTGEMVFDIFKRMVQSRGLTAVVVTHNPQIAGWCDRRYLLQNGQVIEI